MKVNNYIGIATSPVTWAYITNDIKFLRTVKPPLKIVLTWDLPVVYRVGESNEK